MSVPRCKKPCGGSNQFMAEENLKPLLTCFTSNNDFLSILYPQCFLKVWNTSDGSLLAEWNPSDAYNEYKFSCMACAFIKKKAKKGKGTFLVALGTENGDILAINVFTSKIIWKSTGCHPGGIGSLSFANDGHRLHTVYTKGMVSEMNSETGECVKESKISKKSIISSSFSCNDHVVAATTSCVLVLSQEDGNELVKLTADLGSVQHISVSDDAKTIVTSVFGKKHLQVMKCDLSTGSIVVGPRIKMKTHPLAFQCRKGLSAQDSVVVLAVSDSFSGVTYIWNLNTSSDNDVKPVKISVKANKTESDSTSEDSKSCASIFAAKIHALKSDDQVSVLLAYGSINSPQFSLLDIHTTGEDIVISAKEEVQTTTNAEQNEPPAGKGLYAEAGLVHDVKSSKKRPTMEPETAKIEALLHHGHGESMDGVLSNEDLNEPTMGEKLADLDLAGSSKVENHEQQQPSQTKLPSADSVHLLLKQALHADDRVLLLDCLHRRDEKVVANSVSLLNPSDVLKLLQSLISLIESRGKVLVYALPWLKNLLLQHASSIMSHESSLVALNSLYQLIESRVSNFNSALQLSSSLDLLYAATLDDDEVDEDNVIEPTIFEDKDDSDEEESEDAMETDGEDNTEAQILNDSSDID